MIKLSCLFGHTYVTNRYIKQTVQNKHSNVIGYDVYVVKKCEKCAKEKGIYINYWSKQPEKVSVDYINAIAPDREEK
jgi:hypothetical protein